MMAAGDVRPIRDAANPATDLRGQNSVKTVLSFIFYHELILSLLSDLFALMWRFEVSITTNLRK